MKKTPVIIDCDPGKDDAFALFYAIKEPRLDIRMITTVSGNVSIKHTSRNALGIVGAADSNIPVYMGAKEPLIAKPYFADYIHGPNGLGGFEFEESVYRELAGDNAVEAIYKELKDSEDEISIITLGPLTNIAKLLIMYPDSKDSIKTIYMMGGGLKGGNTTIASEFNIYVDPEAAKIVFESGIPIVMAGLDVTEQASLKVKNLEEIRNTSKVGQTLEQILILQSKPNYNNQEDIVSNLHDVLAVMAVNDMDLFTYKDLFVTVELSGDITRGMTIADQRQNPKKDSNTRVLLGLDHDRFYNKLIERLKEYE